ncbi:MAG TPA: hypothetical protein PLX79_03530 [Candidatus Dojkabacteria bacterium]|nr:hypothetical protein [Candidatus Dojkabacteria bacterium]
MTDQIVTKLQNLLNQDIPLNNEVEVVYYFVEIRKLLEKNKITNEYPTAGFYSDWCLHPIISYENSIKRIGEILDLMEEGNGYSGMSQMISFKHLKRELAELNRRFQLPNFTLDGDIWLRFAKNLRNILIEQPIEISYAKETHIKSIKFTDSFKENRFSLQVEFYADETGKKRSVTYNTEIGS